MVSSGWLLWLQKVQLSGKIAECIYGLMSLQIKLLLITSYYNISFLSERMVTILTLASVGILSFGAFGPVIFGTCFTQLLWPGGDTHVQVGQSFHLIRMSPKWGALGMSYTGVGPPE